MNPVDVDETTIPPPADECNELGAPGGMRADTLADSVVILLSLTVIQRVVGLCRAVLFCRWLEPEQLGLWDMAFSFLMLAAPLSMLALPSAFGRYLEHYRQQGQLRTMIARTAWTVGCLVGLVCAGLYLGRAWFSELIFGSPGHETLVSYLAVALGVVVSTHFFIDLLTALRNVRFLAVIQFVNSLAFALFGAGLIFGVGQTAGSVVVAYGSACLFSSVLVVWRLRPTWQALPRDTAPPTHRSFWGKIVPYVVWVSATSLTANLFEIADRYMIIHYSTGGPEAGLMQVGQYHSSRVVPLLMVSIAVMLGAMVTPHLSADWESGRRDRVQARLNLFLKLLALALSAAAVAVLIAAPLLFDWAFRGKFDDGRAVLPMTLCYCIWFGLTLVSQNYLLCAEKARLGSLALGAGLVCNVVLNRILLPRYGLTGAVAATTVANLVALGLLSTFSYTLGFRMHRATAIALAVPALLIWGPWPTAAALAVLGVLAWRTDWILDPAEKEQLAEVGRTYLVRVTHFARRDGHS
ncbi:MAG: lipopolysaccharide biosynthesis protein [Pirellulales bacterium]|nr:lipopolysaccharide biosynthesis protein [Pirellulales bacterium]